MNARHLPVAVVALFVVVLLGWWFGSSPYPEATSPRAMHLIKALYTACSSQDPGRLAKVEEELATAAASRLVTEPERLAFEQIIATARQGDWKKASAESYRFAEAQVR